MENQRKRLKKVIDQIQDENTLERILQFVEEEAAIYKTAKINEHLEKWQIEEIQKGIRQFKEGRTVTLEEAKNRLSPH